ncbi:hypothetical protein M8J76_017264 [Diaphorina citri]|nr:hypothetical protein M8J76_017264 [Diaphorina citri]
MDDTKEQNKPTYGWPVSVSVKSFVFNPGVKILYTEANLLYKHTRNNNEVAKVNLDTLELETGGGIRKEEGILPA